VGCEEGGGGESGRVHAEFVVCGEGVGAEEEDGETEHNQDSTIIQCRTAGSIRLNIDTFRRKYNSSSIQHIS